MTETITPDQLKARQARQMRERGRDGLQQQVMDLLFEAGFMAYHTFDSRRSAAGFPDIVAVKTGKRTRLLFIELKRERGHPTEQQMEWLSALTTIRDQHMLDFVPCPVEVYVWRPSHLLDGTVAHVLTGESA